MKKSINLLALLFILLCTTPIFAQADPGDDPVEAAPIDDYILFMALIGFLFAFLKLRAYLRNVPRE